MRKTSLFLALVVCFFALALNAADAQEAGFAASGERVYCHANDVGNQYGMGLAARPPGTPASKSSITDMTRSAPTPESCHEAVLADCRAASTHPADCVTDYDQRKDYQTYLARYPDYASPDLRESSPDN